MTVSEFNCSSICNEIVDRQAFVHFFTVSGCCFTYFPRCCWITPLSRNGEEDSLNRALVKRSISLLYWFSSQALTLCVILAHIFSHRNMLEIIGKAKAAWWIGYLILKISYLIFQNCPNNTAIWNMCCFPKIFISHLWVRSNTLKKTFLIRWAIAHIFRDWEETNDWLVWLRQYPVVRY